VRALAVYKQYGDWDAILRAAAGDLALSNLEMGYLYDGGGIRQQS
jgi:hypothetical protein